MSEKDINIENSVDETENENIFPEFEQETVVTPESIAAQSGPRVSAEEPKEKKHDKRKLGKLFIVSTPIGNKSDYTQRAVDALRVADLVVCEEYKEGGRIMRELNLHKELFALNEQNEQEDYPEIIRKIDEGTKVALVSDCGTPLFADPGHLLVDAAIEHGITIEIVPGATSIMAALVRSNMDISKFYYAGFLDRKPEVRRQEIAELAKHPSTVCLLETPYRLRQVIGAFAEVIPNRKAYIGMNLTMKHESHHYGTFSELEKKFAEEKIKAEFVIVFEGNKAVGFKNVKFEDKPVYKRRATPDHFDNKRSRKFEDKYSGGRKYDDRPKRRDDSGGRKYDDRPKRRDDSGGRKYDDRPKRRDDSGGRKYDGRPKRRDDSGGRKYDDRPKRRDDSGGRKYDDRPRRRDY